MRNLRFTKANRPSQGHASGEQAGQNSRQNLLTLQWACWADRKRNLAGLSANGETSQVPMEISSSSE